MGAHSSHTQGRARPTLPKSAHLRCPWSRSKTLTWGSSLESEHKGPKAQEAEREPHGAACPAAKVNAPGLGRCDTGRGWGEGANEGPELISGCTCDAARTGSQWAAQPRTPHFPVRARRAAWAVPPSGQARLRAEGVAAEASGDCPGHREVCSSGCLAPLGCRWARSLCPGQHQATTWKGSSVPSELPERAFLSPGGTRPALCGRLSAGREEQECFCAGSEGTEMLSPRP